MIFVLFCFALQHMYVSLSEIQIKEEDDASNRPFTKVPCYKSVQ